MEIITDIEKLKLNNTCVTVGKFDGFHLGHKKLLTQMNKISNFKKVLITFDKTPNEILNGSTGRYILSSSEKQIMCERNGIDVYLCIPLTQKFLDMTAEQFIADILVEKLGACCVVMGEDFRFGKGRAGNVDTLQKFSEKYGYDVLSVPNAEYQGKNISSTRIKEAIKKGKIEEANNMLGYEYIITGNIEHGRRIGTKMELPTANIIPDVDKVLPPNGVYKTVVVTEDNKCLSAISNIGINPTVTEEMKLKLESHILDFNEEIYGKFIEVRLLNFVRPERKFNSIEELKKQINSDIEKCKIL